MKNFAGKIAFAAGAAHGIGRGIARALARQGARGAMIAAARLRNGASSSTIRPWEAG